MRSTSCEHITWQCCKTAQTAKIFIFSVTKAIKARIKSVDKIKQMYFKPPAGNEGLLDCKGEIDMENKQMNEEVKGENLDSVVGGSMAETQACLKYLLDNRKISENEYYSAFDPAEEKNVKQALSNMFLKAGVIVQLNNIAANTYIDENGKQITQNEALTKLLKTL